MDASYSLMYGCYSKFEQFVGPCIAEFRIGAGSAELFV